MKRHQWTPANGKENRAAVEQNKEDNQFVRLFSILLLLTINYLMSQSLCVFNMYSMLTTTGEKCVYSEYVHN